MYGPLGFLFDLPFGNVTEQFDKNPTEIWIAARALAAVLCTAGVAATYWAARRLWGVREGLVAAALLAFAFLPVAYSRMAVTDVGALLGVALALGLPSGRTRTGACGSSLRPAPLRASRLRSSTRRDWRSLPLAIAAFARMRVDGARALGGLALGGGLAGLVFVALNPYLFGSLDAWWSDLRDQAEVAADEPKPGQESGGVSYYLDSLTWGLGWAAAIAALAGAALELRRNLVRGLMLVAVPLALFVYLSVQSRYFGRWLLPAYPALAMLAAAAIGRAADAARVQTRRRAPRPRRGLAAALAASPCSCSSSRSPRTSAARRCSGATTRASRRATGSRRTTRPSCGSSVEPAVPGRWFRSNPEGDPPSWLTPLRAARPAGPSRAGRTWRPAAQRVCAAVQARPRRAPRRRRPGVRLPRGARPRGDRRLPPLRLLPGDDGGRGARPRPPDRRPGRARLLRPAGPRVARRARVQPVRRGRRPGPVQLRPLLQLLPARVPPAGADRADLPARRLPAGLRVRR